MRIRGKKIAMLVEEDFEDVELTEPQAVLKEAGAEVVIVGSSSKKTYRGKRSRTEIVADTIADDVSVDDYDALVVPGGYAPDKMRLHPAMVDLARRMNEAGKVIAAVCHGPQLLISAGIVRGRRMTSYASVAVDLENAGAIWVDEAVVVDGNLITSRKPADLAEFNEAIISALERVPHRTGLRERSS